MKKRMTILSMVLVLALGFAGCGKKPAEAPADAAAPAEEAVQETAEETSGSYLVLVTDEENAPIPGTSIQFCSDTTCILRLLTRNRDTTRSMFSRRRKAMPLMTRNTKHLQSPAW